MAQDNVTPIGTPAAPEEFPETPLPDPPTFWHLAEHLGCEFDGWPALVEAAVEAAVAVTHPEIRHRKSRIMRLLNRLFETDKELFFELETEIADWGADTMRTAALLGYAAARTWPTSPEEMEDWHLAAAGYAESGGQK